jgi:hypothetical protein
MGDSHVRIRRGAYRPRLPHILTTFTLTTVCPTVRPLCSLSYHSFNCLITDLLPFHLSPGTQSSLVSEFWILLCPSTYLLPCDECPNCEDRRETGEIRESRRVRNSSSGGIRIPLHRWGYALPAWSNKNCKVFPFFTLRGGLSGIRAQWIFGYGTIGREYVNVKLYSEM